MKSNCINNQQLCYHYNKDYPLIEFHTSSKCEVAEYNPADHVVMFVTQGSLRISLNMYKECVLGTGSFFFHPRNVKSLIESLEDYSIIIFRFPFNFLLCAQFPLEKLSDDKQTKQKELQSLPVRGAIKSFLDNVVDLFQDKNYCSYFHELKLKEFLFLIKVYYSEKELQRFFHPILNKDLEFAEKIYANLHKVKTVKDLIEIFNYSYSGFEKRFKRVFGISVYKWLQNERAKLIFHNITCTTKTIASIGYDFGFRSPSHFNDYCKRMFKETPGSLRKTNKIKALV
ncbi:helix-turn-helix domain-containing protein [Bacteroidales bacterium OttesenSCG-928-B11]|nr:helix-turn-helix domain-containing protein [Bacteroidales bacterium OttesenSCG-928-E04]MDL2312341.1 helix-turn-helix domain-containing protein [Bacteroidales bacterium OttesenSCG-928-B11]